MENKHNAELQRTNPGTKVTGEFSANGPYFPYDMSHAMHISRITKVTLKNYPKNLEKNDPFDRKYEFFKTNNQKSSISNGTRFSHPKYHISMLKTVTSRLKPKIR